MDIYPTDEDIDVPYIENPTLTDLLKALPADISPQARLVFLVFWDDVPRMSGPTEITISEMSAITRMSRAAVYRAIADLRRAKLVGPSILYHYATGSRWDRIVYSPLVISPEGNT